MQSTARLECSPAPRPALGRGRPMRSGRAGVLRPRTARRRDRDRHDLDRSPPLAGALIRRNGLYMGERALTSASAHFDPTRHLCNKNEIMDHGGIDFVGVILVTSRAKSLP